MRLLIVLMMLTVPVLGSQDCRSSDLPAPAARMCSVGAVQHYLVDHRRVGSWYLLQEAGEWSHQQNLVTVPFLVQGEGQPRPRQVDVTFELERDSEGNFRVTQARVTRVHRRLPTTTIL